MVTQLPLPIYPPLVPILCVVRAEFSLAYRYQVEMATARWHFARLPILEFLELTQPRPRGPLWP